MQGNTSDSEATIEYTVELHGNLHDHSVFREQVHEHNGTITGERNIDSSEDDIPSYIMDAVAYAEDTHYDGELAETEAANEAAMDLVMGMQLTNSEGGQSVMTLLNDLMELGYLCADDIQTHKKTFTPDIDSSYKDGSATLNALAYRSLEEFIIETMRSEAKYREQ